MNTFETKSPSKLSVKKTRKIKKKKKKKKKYQESTIENFDTKNSDEDDISIVKSESDENISRK